MVSDNRGRLRIIWLLVLVLTSTLVIGCTKITASGPETQTTENFSLPTVDVINTSPTTPSSEVYTSNPPADILDREGYLYPEIPRITCEQLKPLLEAGDDIILIDIRDEAKFVKGHLQGAINIYYSLADDETTRGNFLALPDNKMKVFYCDCADDKESAGLASKLIEVGYKAENIRVIWKGYFRWLELGYPITDES